MALSGASVHGRAPLVELDASRLALVPGDGRVQLAHLGRCDKLRLVAGKFGAGVLYVLREVADVAAPEHAVRYHPGHLLAHFLVRGLAEVHEVVAPGVQDDVALLVAAGEIALAHGQLGEVCEGPHLEQRDRLGHTLHLLVEPLRDGPRNVVDGLYAAFRGSVSEPVAVLAKFLSDKLLRLQLHLGGVELLRGDLGAVPLALEVEFL